MSDGGQSITAAEVADFLEQGVLDALVSLFKAEPSLYAHLGELLRDERIMIRLGASALVETLAGEDPEHIEAAVAPLVSLLSSDNPVLRGDAAYLLGMIGRPEARDPLRALVEDENDDVREAVREALESLSR